MSMSFNLLLLLALFALLHGNVVMAKEADATPMPAVVQGFTPEQEQAMASSEKFEFQAEVNRLMDIIINSLYKNKEVFLREMISNAADALDKIRFMSLSNADILSANKELEIKISFDSEKKTLTLRDTGIGMTKADLVANLGTVAKSGTTAFVESIAKGQDIGMIGQFGVGFYSVYLVADKVRVVSKNAEDDQYIWESTADSSFTVVQDPRGNTLGRGTEITLFLKEDAQDLLDQNKLEELVTRYSEFITFPISLYKRSEEVVEVEEVEEEEDTTKSTDDVDVAEEDDEKKSATPKTETIVSWDWARLNNNVAIWSRESKDITTEEYQKFYKAICAKSEASEALDWIHFKAEGEVEFKSILYIPSDAGNLYNEYTDKQAGVKLYVRKVLIQDDFDDLLPRYLNFIKGVVDSDDLPLNVSRETLQQHKVLKVMSKKLVRKALEMLRKMATSGGDDDEESEEVDEKKDVDSEKYTKFWEQFGKSIKMGVVEDASNRSKLAKLLRFKSSSTVAAGTGYTSFDRYISKMPEWQKDIYYLAGESLEQVQKSPFLQSATMKKIDVLFLTDPIDEYAVQHLGDYDGHKLVALNKEGLKFSDEDEEVSKKRVKLYKDNFKGLTKYLKDLYGSKVSKVSVAQHPLQAPSVIVSSQYGHSANMERIMKAQTFAAPQAGGMPSQRNMEINPRHPIIVELNNLIQNGDNDESIADLAHLLYDTALVASGFVQEDPSVFAERMYRVMGNKLNVKAMELADEIEIPAEEPAAVEDSAGGDEF